MTSASNTIQSIFNAVDDILSQVLSIPESDGRDDAIPSNTKKFFNVWVITFGLWWITMVCVLFVPIACNSFPAAGWLFFIPMWTGSIVGFAGSLTVFWRLYFQSVVIPKERREYLIVQGIADGKIYVDLENISKLRELVLWSAIGGLFSIVSFYSQIAYVSWLSISELSAYVVFAPFGISCLFIVLFCFRTNLLSARSCGLTIVLMLQIMLVFFRLGSQFRRSDSQLSWLIVTAPVYAIIGLLFDDMKMLCQVAVAQSSFRLLPHQYFILLSYSISFCILLSSSLCAIINDIFGSRKWEEDLMCLSWLVSITLVLVSIFTVCRFEIVKITSGNRNFGLLLPVSSEEQSELEENGLANSTRIWSLLAGEVFHYSSLHSIGSDEERSVEMPSTLQHYGATSTLAEIVKQ